MWFTQNSYIVKKPYLAAGEFIEHYRVVLVISKDRTRFEYEVL